MRPKEHEEHEVHEEHKEYEVHKQPEQRSYWIGSAPQEGEHPVPDGDSASAAAPASARRGTSSMPAPLRTGPHPCPRAPVSRLESSGTHPPPDPHPHTPAGCRTSPPDVYGPKA